jgi:hypothetical protein
MTGLDLYAEKFGCHLKSTPILQTQAESANYNIFDVFSIRALEFV